jgi:hypothetical protein
MKQKHGVNGGNQRARKENPLPSESSASHDENDAQDDEVRGEGWAR